MDNFEFKNPTKIIFGKGQIAKLADEISANVNVLLTYGFGSIKKNGVYDQVINALSHVNVFEFAGIEPNPSYETLIKAKDIIISKDIDFILAVGGGSVIDGSKFIAAAAHFDGEPWDILAKQAAIKSAIPLGCVLTLPATGTEMNCNSVVTRQSTQEKLYFGSPLVYPVFSILDPETTFSLPPRQIGNGIVDAFVHVIEQYLTYPNNTPLQDRIAEAVLLTLIAEGPKTFNHPNDYNARANFMWAATNALNGLIACGAIGDWATHMIGHELTALHGLDHGQTLAIVLPSVMLRMRENKKQKLLLYAKRVWNLKNGSEEERIDTAIENTRGFFESVGVKTRLSDYNLTADIIAPIVDRLATRGALNIGEHRDIDKQKVTEILELSL